MACDVRLLAQICCSHLFCWAGFKCSHFDRNSDGEKKGACVQLESLALRFAERWGESLEILQFTEVNSLQEHSQGLKRFALCSVPLKCCDTSRSWINASVRPNPSLINVVLHLEKVVCQCSKINWLFALAVCLPGRHWPAWYGPTCELFYLYLSNRSDSLTADCKRLINPGMIMKSLQEAIF